MSAVEVQHDGHVTIITLNRPDHLNTMSRDLLIELADAFNDFESGSSRVAVLTGRGRAFSVGMDIKAPRDAGGGLSLPDITPLINPYWDVTNGLPVDRTVRKPVIAAVNGYAVGGGFYLATHADLIVAAESAVFEVSEVLLGYVAGWELAALHNLQRAIAMELAMGERITAQRAYEGGLINRVVPDAELLDTAVGWATSVAARPPLAVLHGRQLVVDLMPTVPAAARRTANQLKRTLAETHDAHEAVAAFAERRTPDFSGD